MALKLSRTKRLGGILSSIIEFIVFDSQFSVYTTIPSMLKEVTESLIYEKFQLASSGKTFIPDCSMEKLSMETNYKSVGRTENGDRGS